MKLVFVSSTFRDMQHERDAISTFVAPRLDAFLEKYAEGVHFGDLRWGVNTTELESEEGSKKVLSVCLDQIDDSRPYMIVLIGERYGWIPAYELLHEAALLKGIDENVIDESTSVTNLEIEYGALLNPDYEGRVLFYFRNPLDTSKMSEGQRADYECESDLHRKKMDELKAKILEKYPNYVRYYDAYYDSEDNKVKGLEPLCEMIYEDLVKIFDLDLTYINSLPPQKRALLSSEKHFEKLYQSSYVREASYLNDFDIDDIEYFYQARYEHNPVLELLQGESGAGAKTIVAQEYNSCIEREENALCFSFGFDEFTATLEQFKEMLVYSLENYLGIANGTYTTKTKDICELFEKYTKDQSLPYLRVFAINAPKNIILFFAEVSAIMPNLFGIGFHIHLRFGINSDTPVPFFPKSIVTDVPELERKEAKAVIKAVLKTKRKELPEIVISEMVKHKGSKSPLYLSLLTQRLIMLDYEDFAAIRKMGDGMDNINKYMISLIKAVGDDVKSLSKELLTELVQRINPEMAKHLIAHMTLKSHLSEKGIKELFEYANWNYTSLDYAIFKRTFPSLMYENSKGMLFFVNDDILQGAKELTAELGCENDIDIVIKFLMTKSSKVRYKALGRMLYEKKNASALLDEYLPAIDVSSELLANNKEALSNFNEYMEYLENILTDSLEENPDFLLDLIKELCTRIYDGKVANPYTVSSFLFNFINPDYSNMQEVSDALDITIDVAEIIEKINVGEQNEALCVIAQILYSLYVPTFLGLATTERQASFVTARLKRKTDTPALILELVKQGKLKLRRQMERSSSTISHMYRTIKSSQNPTQDTIDIFFTLCNGMEQEAFKRAEDYYSKLISAEYIPSDYSEIIFLGINAFRYELIENYDAAQVCYYAFYNCFDKKIKNEGIDSFFLADYLQLLFDMCKHFIDNKVGFEEMVYNQVLDFAINALTKDLLNVNACGALIRLILLGDDHDFVKQSANYFYLPFEIARKRLIYVTDTGAIIDTFEFLKRFDFIFTDEEFCYYFNELIFSVIANASRIMKDDMDIIEYVAETVFYYFDNAEVAKEFFEGLVPEILYVYDDGIIFPSTKEEYIKRGIDYMNSLS